MAPRFNVVVLSLFAAAACVSTETVEPATSAALFSEAERQFQGSEYEAASRSYAAAAEAAEREDDASRATLALAQRAHALALDGDLGAAEHALAVALGRADSEQPEAWAATLLARGSVERARGDDARALRAYEQAFAHARTHGLAARAVQAAHLAGLVASPAARVEWARHAVEVAEAERAYAWLADLWARVAWAEEDLGQSERALDAFLRAREAVAGSADEARVMKADWAVGHGLRLARRGPDARMRLERTLAVAERRYGATRAPNDAEWIGHCERELAELDAAEGEPRRALARLQRARARFLEAGIADLAPRSLSELDARIAELAAVGTE